MTAAAKQTSAPDRETASRFPIFVFWVAFQVIALVATRTDLQITGAGHHASFWPAQLLLLAQIAALAVLLHDLCATIRLAALAFAISFPFTQLALIGEPGRLGLSLRSCLVLALWMAGLWGWRRAFAHHGRFLAAAIALWTIGSATVWYLIAEFNIGSATADTLFALSPLLQATRIGTWSGLPLFAIHAAAGLCAAAISITLARPARGQ